MASNKKINIVMFNMSSYTEWQSGIENRNYHILQNLLTDERVNQIIAVDYLPHTFKRALRNFKENIIKRTEGKVIKRSLATKIYQVNDKLIVYSSVLSKFSQQLFYQELKNSLKELEIDDFVVWSYYPLSVDYFELLKAKLYVFDAVDNWIEHPSYVKFKKLLAENYHVIDEKADLIFLVAKELNRLFNRTEKVHYFPNAVDLKHYQQEYPLINRDIGDIVRPIIGYVGTVQDRFDYELFEFLAKSNPEKSFVIIGPVWYPEMKKKLSLLPNVYLLGRKSYQEVPMYIQQFDLGIIPHKIDNFSKYTNPMKVYEYLACGKPVVTTPTADLEELSDIISLADDKLEFNQQINTILQKDIISAEKRLEIIKEHSWLKRVDKMLDLIYQKL
jgi:teichuronic acid biosynthesis glycosyltransferase TuaH